MPGIKTHLHRKSILAVHNKLRNGLTCKIHVHIEAHHGAHGIRWHPIVNFNTFIRIKLKIICMRRNTTRLNVSACVYSFKCAECIPL